MSFFLIELCQCFTIVIVCTVEVPVLNIGSFELFLEGKQNNFKLVLKGSQQYFLSKALNSGNEQIVLFAIIDQVTFLKTRFRKEGMGFYIGFNILGHIMTGLKPRTGEKFPSLHE